MQDYITSCTKCGDRIRKGSKHECPKTVSEMMEVEPSLPDVLTKIYGFTNRLKVTVTFNNKAGSFAILNEMSDYLMSIDVDMPPILPDHVIKKMKD